MDRKTLEYMEERAKDARKIVKKIESLKKNIELTERVEGVKFHDHRHTFLFDASIGGLANEMKETYISVATNEIEFLERQLAEL